MTFAYQAKQVTSYLVSHSSFLAKGLFTISVLLLNFAVVNAADAKPSAVEHPTAQSVFAEVNGEEISIQEFQSAFQAGMRKRFYHGKIPKEELQAFRKEVTQKLIDRVLLVEEARRLNIKVDDKKIAKQLAEYEKRYSGKTFWKENKEQVLPGLKKALEGENLISVFMKQTKDVALPTEEQAEVFYQKNPALFTTPEKMRVSLILLKVSPASPAGVWEAAKQEADDILKRLNKGADFAELARIHSGDPSAIKGGDMGFVHQGMLAEPAEKALDKLTVGQVSEAVMSLRGIAIFRLDEKQEATLNGFENVTERARKLLQRENSQTAWAELLEKLRANAKITINSAVLAVNNK